MLENTIFWFLGEFSCAFQIRSKVFKTLHFDYLQPFWPLLRSPNAGANVAKIGKNLNFRKNSIWKFGKLLRHQRSIRPQNFVRASWRCLTGGLCSVFGFFGEMFPFFPALPALFCPPPPYVNQMLGPKWRKSKFFAKILYENSAKFSDTSGRFDLKILSGHLEGVSQEGCAQFFDFFDFCPFFAHFGEKSIFYFFSIMLAHPPILAHKTIFFYQWKIQTIARIFSIRSRKLVHKRKNATLQHFGYFAFVDHSALTFSVTFCNLGQESRIFGFSREVFWRTISSPTR